MISLATVFTKGGAVLWSMSINTFNPLPINILIQKVLMEGQIGKNTFRQSLYSVKWVLENDLGLVFAVVYLNITQILHIENLLEQFKKDFCRIHSKTIPAITLKKLKKFEFTEQFKKIEKSLKSKSLKTKSINTEKKPDRKSKENFQSAPTKQKSKEAQNDEKPFSNSKNPSKKEGSIQKGAEMNKTKEKRVWRNKKLNKKEKMALDFSKKDGNDSKPALNLDFDEDSNFGQTNKNVNLESSDDEKFDSETDQSFIYIFLYIYNHFNE